ncbi:MAG TPA: ABC transporter permease [Candidatus Baltobacteraceae bacterium]|nr:ABC transporter permease [Candidatus Baltobacteraceae bacterium]
MDIRDTARTAFKGLSAHKTRSFLTMLGIIIGISSVIMMMSLGAGAQDLIVGQISSFGPDTLFVRGGGDSNGPPNFAQLQAIKYADYQAVQRLPSVKAAAPILQIDATLSYQGQNSVPTVYGTTPDYFEMNRTGLDEGRLFDKTDLDGAANVVVIGHQLALDLFNGDEPLDKAITINRKTFIVIGTLPAHGASLFLDQDRSAYVPITTAKKELSGVNYITFMMVQAKGDVDYAADDVRFLLRDRHKIDNPAGDAKKDDFLVRTQVQAADTLSTVTSALTLFLSAIASISLVVGGIGIMNIMLVSVTERTREIGLRKAVGATRGNIMLQFLLEAIMLTMLGGLIGVAIGGSFSFIAAKIIANYSSGWKFSLPFSGIALSVGVATLVGLVFGLYPAQKASKLDPIEALRYE